MESEEVDFDIKVMQINKVVNELNLKAAEHWKNEDYPACLNYIDAALKADSTNPVLFFKKAQILNKMDNLPRALIALEKALEYNPRYDDAMDLLNFIQKRIDSRYSMAVYS